MHRIAASLLALIVLVACGDNDALDQDPVGRFSGKWEVDIERTLTEMEEIEDLASLSHEEKLDHIMKYMGHMKVEVSSEAFTLISRGGPVAMPLQLKSSADEATVVTLEDRNLIHECTLTKIGADGMNIRMSSGDNFDLYVWKRTG